MPIEDRDIFVNCPFDPDYQPVFHAIVFTVIRSGFRVRCALESDDASENRLSKICAIIKECRYGVHDISRTESHGEPPLPRFNMPLELGLFLGAKRFGNREQKAKRCLIFDRERFRYQRYVSDIAGQDIHSHDGDEARAIEQLAAWLRGFHLGAPIPGGRTIAVEFELFKAELPAICRTRSLDPAELTFRDINQIIVEHLAAGTQPLAHQRG